MAKLPEGMKARRTEWNSTHYTYKGVDIYKRGDGYYFTIEYIISETGNSSTRAHYAAYKLADVPGDIENYLSNHAYTLDGRGIFRLTEYYKAGIRKQSKEHTEAEITSCHEAMREALEAKEYAKLETYARHMQKLLAHWSIKEKEQVSA